MEELLNERLFKILAFKLKPLILKWLPRFSFSLSAVQTALLIRFNANLSTLVPQKNLLCRWRKFVYKTKQNQIIFAKVSASEEELVQSFSISGSSAWAWTCQIFYLSAASGCSDCGGTLGQAGSLQRWLQSPCSAPAQPCHHCSHFFPQQGGGAPVPEQGLLCSQDLDGGGRVLGQVGQTASMRDQPSSHLKTIQSVSIYDSVIWFQYGLGASYLRTISTG